MASHQAFQADRFLQSLQHQFHMLLHPAQPLIPERGNRSNTDPRRQEEMVHHGPGGGTGRSEDHSGNNPCTGGGASGSKLGGGAPQEERPHQEEVSPMPASAPPGIRHHSSQEEQVVQAAHHQPLQAYLIPGDILIHGLHWIDPGKLYRSSHCPPTIRVAAYWTCSRF